VESVSPETDSREMEVILSRQDFRIGELLPWAVYDDKRILLLPEGTRITNGKQLDKLMANRPRRYVLIPPAPKPQKVKKQPPVRQSSFEIADILLERLEIAYDALHNDQDNSFTRRIMHLVFDIQGLCEADADAMLGTMQLMHEAQHGLIHPLHAGILAEVACTRMGKGPLDRFPLVAAALTHDMGMYEIQEELYHQQTPLTIEQEHIIKSHSKRSYELLKKQGITEIRWLDPVLHHHERLDGSGYPDGLKGDQLTHETRLMAIVDCYSAMIRPRAYRSRVLPKEALKELFQARGSTIDAELARVFVNVLGVFSPGSLVELENGSIAVVRNRTENLAAPDVTLLTDTQGAKLAKTRVISTEDPDNTIKGMICPKLHCELFENIDDIWSKLPPLSRLL